MGEEIIIAGSSKRVSENGPEDAKVPKGLRDYFALVCVTPLVKGDKAKEKIILKCKLCGAKHSSEVEVTSNFIRHLKTNHKGEYGARKAEEEAQKDTDKSAAGRKDRIQHYFGKPTGPVGRQTAKYPTESLRWKDNTKRLMDTIAHDMLPLDIVEREKFQLFCSGLDPAYQLPSRRTIGRYFETHAEKKIERHTGKQILRAVKDTLLTFDKMTHDIGYCITDNAANMIKALSLTKDDEQKNEGVDEENDSESDINDDNGPEGSEESSKADFSGSEATGSSGTEDCGGVDEISCAYDSDVMEDIEEFLNGVPDGANETDVDFGTSTPGFDRLPCAAHTLQLSLKDGLKAAKQIRVFGAVKKIVVFFRRSTHWSTKLMKETDYKLILPVDTRWNSQYLMLVRFVKPFQDAEKRILEEPSLINLESISYVKGLLKNEVDNHENIDEDNRTENADGSSLRSRSDSESSVPDDLYSVLCGDQKEEKEGLTVEDYLNEKNVDRKTNPLDYWKVNSSKYPGLAALAMNRINEGKQLLEKLADPRYGKLRGRDKLERRISAELKFLQKMQHEKGTSKKEHVLSSNLQSLSAIVRVLETATDPVSVLQVFHFGGNKVEVDLVSNSGNTWHKAVARSPEALNRICQGDSSYGKKSILDQAFTYLDAADENPYKFKTPKVEFYFANGVSSSLASRLARLGVAVNGTVCDIPSACDDSDSSEEESYSDETADDDQNTCDDDKIFLDITALVALVSSLTNGGAHFSFPRELYNQQAAWERIRPAKKMLESALENRKLYTCDSAVRDFRSVVATIGGPSEKQRAEKLLETITVIPDRVSERVSRLKLTANVKERSRIIFGTADFAKMVIVTANSSFVNSAAGQGVKLAVISHEPRVLTEREQMKASPL
nr:EOG090X0CWG [Eulimnadia texana]